MIKKTLIIPLILSILEPTITLSKMPPDSVIKKNQETEVIVIGEVYDKGAALMIKNPPESTGKSPLIQFIVLKVVHVIKGDGKIKPDNLIHILSQNDLEKQYDPNICHTQGIFPFQIKKGILFIVYADTVPNNPGFYSNRTILPFLPSVFFVGSF